MNYKNKINMNLNDIKGYVESALIYLKNEDNNLDKDEIIMYLSSTEEIINDIKESIIKSLYYIKNNYKKDINKYIDDLIVTFKEDNDYE